MEGIPVCTLSHPIIQKRDDSGGIIGKGLEFVEGRQGAACLVVEERGVVPACGKVARTAFGISLGIPPGETVDLRMLLQGSDEVGGVLALAFVGIGIGLGVVVGRAAHLPFRGIACLHELYLLIGEVLFQLRQTTVEIRERAFVIGIVRDADDVVVDLILLDVTEEGDIERGIVGALLGVEDNPSLGTHLTTGLACSLQHLGEVDPMLVGIVLPVCGGFKMTAPFFPIFILAVLGESPQHAETDFVARLDKVGYSTGSHERFECFLGVVINRLIGCPAPYFPGIGDDLFSRVCPCVAIVDVEQEQKSSILDTLAKCLHIFEILTDVFVLIVRGIDKESHAHRVPALLLQEVEHICDGRPVLIEIGSVLLFIFQQDGDVASDVFLRYAK